jgi:hypothetical protein
MNMQLILQNGVLNFDMTTTIDELLEIYKKKTVIKQPGSFRQKVAQAGI